MSGYVGKRYFTLEQANALLPQVRARLTRAMQLSAHLHSNAQGDRPPTPPGTPWLADPVVAAWEAQNSERTSALSACMAEALSEESRALESLGVEVDDLALGCVTFPSYLDGANEVMLCWKLEESEIRYYRPTHSTQRGRKSVEGHTFLAAPRSSRQLRE